MLVEQEREETIIIIKNKKRRTNSRKQTPHNPTNNNKTDEPQRRTYSTSMGAADSSDILGVGLGTGLGKETRRRDRLQVVHERHRALCRFGSREKGRTRAREKQKKKKHMAEVVRSVSEMTHISARERYREPY